jgi:hypothetical protein
MNAVEVIRTTDVARDIADFNQFIRTALQSLEEISTFNPIVVADAISSPLVNPYRL